MASTSSSVGIDTTGRKFLPHEMEKPIQDEEPMEEDSCEEDEEEVGLKHVPPKRLPIRYPDRRMMGKDYGGPFGTSKKTFWSKKHGAYMVGHSDGFNIRFKRYRKKNGIHQLYIQMNTVNDGIKRSTWQCWPMDGALEFCEAIHCNYEEARAYAPENN